MTASEVLDIKFDCLSHKKQFYIESTSSCLLQHLNSLPSEVSITNIHDKVEYFFFFLQI